MANGRRQGAAGQAALCGILAALSLVFLYGASVAPTGQLGLTAIAGLFPMAAVISAGWKAGVSSWAAAGILALLLIPGKGIAFLFLIFLGCYPVLKSAIEQIGKQVPEWICKLIFFNAALAVSLILLGALLMNMIPERLQVLWLLWPAANVVFIIYDIGLSKLALLYLNRVDKRLQK